MGRALANESRDSRLSTTMNCHGWRLTAVGAAIAARNRVSIVSLEMVLPGRYWRTLVRVMMFSRAWFPAAVLSEAGVSVLLDVQDVIIVIVTARRAGSLKIFFIVFDMNKLRWCNVCWDLSFWNTLKQMEPSPDFPAAAPFF